MKIKNVSAREILDSRGLPTIECEIILDNGASVISSCPTGLSLSKYEAFELRDDDNSRYFGLGVLNAVDNVNKKIVPLLINKVPNFVSMDKAMIQLDGTKNKSNLGSNAILAVSIAIIKAQAVSEGKELFQFISDFFGTKSKMPIPMFNVLNGGLHASNGLCFQEFMIVPSAMNSFSEVLASAVNIYQHLKGLLFETDHSVSVGDEGGFAPMLVGKNGIPDLEALDYLANAIKKAGIKDTKFLIALDAAASSFFDEEEGIYTFHNHEVDAEELIEFYEKLVSKYPFFSIEDGIDQIDYEGWQILNKKLGKQIQIVGDDIFATNVHLITEGIKNKIATTVLIKPNQIGSVSETLDAIRLCKDNNLNIIVSHRSGETMDDFIADLAVGTAAGYIKAGGCSRGERIVKYNRLLKIEKLMSLF